MPAEIYCETALNYAAQDPAPGAPFTEQVLINVLHGRNSGQDRSWAREGFELCHHKSKVDNWLDFEQLQSVYTAEIEELACLATGCDFAISTAPIVRSPESAQKHKDLAPVQVVHSDYSVGYREMAENPNHPYMKMMASSMARNQVGFDDIKAARRIIALHVWRNTGPRKMDYPLAFCDAQSVQREDLFPVPIEGYVGSDTVFETTICRKPRDAGSHRWYVFPEMSDTEVVIFRCYDSECVSEGLPHWAPHSAFRDPNVPGGSPGRESVEMRILCGFRG